MKKHPATTSSERRRVGRPPAGPDGQRVRDYPQISFRVPIAVRRRLEALAAVTGHSRSDLFALALASFERTLPEPVRRQIARRVGRKAGVSV